MPPVQSCGYRHTTAINFSDEKSASKWQDLATICITRARGVVWSLETENIDDVHQSELIVIHFTDGSILSLDTGSNAGNLRCEKHPPQDFHVDFRVHWVPPK